MEHLGNLTELTDLSLSNFQVTDDGMEHLSKLSKLTELKIRNSTLTDASIPHIQALKELRYLSLLRSMISDDGRRRIKDLGIYYSSVHSQWKHPLGLFHAHSKTRSLDGTEEQLEKLKDLDDFTTLDLDDTTDEALKHLEGHPTCRRVAISGSRQFTGSGLKYLNRVEELKLTGFADRGVPDLQSLSSLSSLQRLEIHYLNDDTIQHLEGLTGLKSLILSSLKVSNVGLQHISALHNLDSLQIRLSPHMDRISDEGLRHIGALKNLKELTIYANSQPARITNAGLKHLSALKSLESWTFDYHSNRHFADAGIEHFKHLAHLREIRLRGIFTDTGLQHLTALPKLETLDISRCYGMSDEGVIEQLVKIKTLRELHLSRSVGNAVQGAIRKSLPNCVIRLPRVISASDS